MLNSGKSLHLVANTSLHLHRWSYYDGQPTMQWMRPHLILHAWWYASPLV